MAIAFSARCNEHTEAGPEIPTIQYDREYCDKPDGNWNGSQYVVPQNGIYVISLSFVKEGVPLENGFQGTTDDVYVMIEKQERGTNNWVPLGKAWSGAGTIRSTGACTIAVELKRGDRIRTVSMADSNRPHAIRDCHFTGYLLT